MKTYYSLLNISKTASSEEVKTAYRSMASRYHPDVNADPDAHEIFKILNRAYTVLSDSGKRQDYDRLISGDNIYRTRNDEEIIESSGAFLAYSNLFANLLFFTFLSLLISYFLQWLGEVEKIFWSLSTIKAIAAGALFGLTVGFNSNFQTQELFEKNFRLYKVIFWLLVLSLLGFLGHLNYQLVMSFI